MKELLHFTADWCGPCKMIKPIIEEFISNNPDITYTKIDVDQNKTMVQDNNIMSIPTLIMLVDGVQVKRHTGALTKDQFNTTFAI
jgi:thioredoxin 1